MIQNPARLVLGMALALTTLLADERTSAAHAAPPPSPVDVATLTPAESKRLTDDQLRSLVDEAGFVRGAVSVGGLTPARARHIYWHVPELILSIPTSITTETTATPTSTVSTGSAAPPRVRGCTVTTRRRVRNNLGIVMFWFRFHKHWNYTGSRVLDPSHRHTWGVTGWGDVLGWHFDGIVDEQAWWIHFPRLPRYGHHSERTGLFATHATPVGQLFRSIRRYVNSYANGDWSSSSHVGSPGCGPPR